MKPQELYTLASQLGKGWQSKLARLLPCNPRTVRKWLKGDRRISGMAGERIKIKQVVTEELERMRNK